MQKLDSWNKISLVGGFVSRWASDAYWLATIFDTIGGLEGDILPLSWYSLGFAAVISTLSSLGAGYCNMASNRTGQAYQQCKKDERNESLRQSKSMPVMVSDIDQGQEDESRHKSLQQSKSMLVMVSDGNDNLDTDLDSLETTTEATETTTESSGKLTKGQWLALLGAILASIGKFAGPPIFIAGLIDKDDHLSKLGNILGQVGFTLFGALSSVAHIRTHCIMIKEWNEHQNYLENSQLTLN